MFSIWSFIFPIFHFLPFHKPYFNLQKKYYGRVFVVYVCCWSMLLCIMCYTMISLWTGFLFCFQVLNYFKSRPNITQNMTTESEVFLKKHAPSTFFVFWSWNRGVSVKTRQWCSRSSLSRIFMVWPNYYLSLHLFSGFC